MRVRPLDVGRYRAVARVTGPSSDGVLYRQRGWSTHGGATARPAGVQRGWIAQSNRAEAAVAATSRVRLARPTIVTETSQALVEPGARAVVWFDYLTLFFSVLLIVCALLTVDVLLANGPRLSHLRNS